MKMRTDQELIQEIDRLKKELNAIVIAHNYQLGEIQDIADFNGDSLELSIKANNNSADVIVFCGVKFMAETAYILSPEKTVLLPVQQAGCLMADMVDVDGLEALKAQHPGACTICYVNSTADVKAHCDLCVTSANALKIVASLPVDQQIIFVPDCNLGAYIQRETGRKMLLWEGYCPTHMRLKPEFIKTKKQEFPEAKVLIHPESQLSALDEADEILSTGGMCRYVKDSSAKQFIIATELGIIHRLQTDNPDKQFIPISEQAVCPDMKMTRIIDVYEALKNMQYKVTVPEDIRVKAKEPIIQMLNLSK